MTFLAEATKDDGTQPTLSSEYFLRQSADAAKAVIDAMENTACIGARPSSGQPYRDFFVLEDAETGETILSRRYLYTDEMSIRHGVQFTYKNQRHSLTQSACLSLSYGRRRDAAVPEPGRMADDAV